MVTGKEARAKRQSSKKNNQDCKIWVPPFSIQALQKHTCVIPPPKCNVYKEIPANNTRFRDNYNRGMLPVGIDPRASKVSWKVSIL